jgi:hypothetical protein
VWRDWTPKAAGSYVVCTWLGTPAIATGSTSLSVEPSWAGVKKRGSLVAAATSKTPNGPPRAVFPTAPRHVYARFALRGVKRGRHVVIEFRDTNGHVIRTNARSTGPALAWYTATLPGSRIAKRLGYWLVSVSVEGQTLGRIHFLVPNYATS